MYSRRISGFCFFSSLMMATFLVTCPADPPPVKIILFKITRLENYKIIEF